MTCNANGLLKHRNELDTLLHFEKVDNYFTMKLSLGSKTTRHIAPIIQITTRGVGLP